ncbi:MAG: quinolinate synthase NadA [Phycisphaerales bacterium]|nr:quinolinate synthase NadA [Phycisphaerales bacterium]
MLWQPPLPESYRLASEAELGERIAARRTELGNALLILGHHYQQDDVIRHADLIGDSLKLSQMAAAEAPRRGARTVVFCGVHFMAETADILTGDDVSVVLPDLSAGCSMADMAGYDDTVDAWDAIRAALDADPATRGERVIPITYVNSTAAIKAFVGQHGGACCTSSNAAAVFDWALSGGSEPLREGERVRILFLPDQHLGRNTARSRGFVTEVDAKRDGGDADTALWDPRKPSGGLSPQQIRRACVYLWAGHCSVHKLFRPEHVESLRAANDGTRVIVHPECAQEVVELADLSGSTEFIIDTIRSAEPGTRWAIGTEWHLVNRLCREAQSRGVHARILSECQCLCTTMYRIDQAHLAWVLDGIAQGRVPNRISVHPEARTHARVALERMLALAPARAMSLVD